MTNTGGKGLRVLDAGFLSTVQDAPRYGLARYGLSEAGPAAPLSCRVANYLAGNEGLKPSLEVTLKPPRLLFREATVLGIAGADFGWKLDGRPVDTRFPVPVRPGATLHGEYCRTGLRGYLAFAGGLLAPSWQQSAATHVEAQLGGLRLGRDMDLDFAGGAVVMGERRIRESLPGPLLINGYKTLRVVPGPQQHWLDREGIEALGATVYRVTEHSTRMALRLEGKAVAIAQTPMLSAGAWMGAVQVPPSGIPQVLGCEHPATGGYPIVASVVEADREVLGQLRPREEIRFGWVSLRTALELARRIEAWWELATRKNAANF